MSALNGSRNRSVAFTIVIDAVTLKTHNSPAKPSCR
jgi:hypothetical protein